MFSRRRVLGGIHAVCEAGRASEKGKGDNTRKGWNASGGVQSQGCENRAEAAPNHPANFPFKLPAGSPFGIPLPPPHPSPRSTNASLLPLLVAASLVITPPPPGPPGPTSVPRPVSRKLGLGIM
jgi:hypothetical protein